MGDDGDSNYVLDRTELIRLVRMQGEPRCYNAKGVFLKVLCIRDQTRHLEALERLPTLCNSSNTQINNF